MPDIKTLIEIYPIIQCQWHSSVLGNKRAGSEEIRSIFKSIECWYTSKPLLNMDPILTPFDD